MKKIVYKFSSLKEDSQVYDDLLVLAQDTLAQALGSEEAVEFKDAGPDFFLFEISSDQSDATLIEAIRKSWSHFTRVRESTNMEISEELVAHLPSVKMRIKD